MSKQTALELAERDGVKLNTIYMRRLRSRRKFEKVKSEFDRKWPTISNSLPLVAIGLLKDDELRQTAFKVWCAARGIK